MHQVSNDLDARLGDLTAAIAAECGSEACATMLVAAANVIRTQRGDAPPANLVKFRALTDAVIAIVGAGHSYDDAIEAMFAFAAGWSLQRHGSDETRAALVRAVENLAMRTPEPRPEARTVN